MKAFKKYLTFNLLITSLLSVVLYFILLQYHENEELKKINRSIALHQQQLESFMNDAESTLENLTTMIKLTDDNKTINDTILSLKHQEPRYKNIYILNKKSIVMNASSNQMIGRQLKSFQFFNRNMNLNNISISGKQKDMSGLDVIYLSKFIPDETDRMLVVIELDINGILTVIDAIQSSTTVTIRDFDNNIIFQSTKAVKSSIERTVKLTDLPWKLTMTSNVNIYWMTFEQSLLLFLLISLLTATFQLYFYNQQEMKERMKLQEEINMQKKELIGMLAAGAAHEIKNPLTAIKGFVDLIEMKYDKEHRNPHFNIIKQEISRINDIVSQFLLLGKPTANSSMVIDARIAVQEVLSFLKYDVELNHSKLVSSFSNEAAWTDMSQDQLKQIVLNLIQNAKESIDADKQGIIEVKVITNDDIYITIRDNGSGMSKETVKHLFEPFFTTKDNGTGLGLPVTKSLIEAHDGTITAKSQLGSGTTFIIKLKKAAVPSEN